MLENKTSLLKHELIGLSAEVVKSNNKHNIGIKGKIIDETKHTLIIIHNKIKKRLMKKNIKIKVRFNHKDYIIDCKKIQKRPEERLKLR